MNNTTPRTTMYDPTTMTIGQWMAHRTKHDTVHWFRISAELGDWLRPATGRDDVITTVEPGTGHGAPAVFLPETAAILVDPDICAPGENPADIRLDTATGRLTHAPLAGAGRHEAGHAAYTHWPIDQSPAARTVMKIALTLEEPAMEKDVITADPGARVLLRASFHGIVNSGDNEPDTPAGAAHLACLAHGRADAGVLDHDEITAIVQRCTSIIGAQRYEQLRQVWLDVQALPSPRTDAAAMAEHARRWLDILGDDAPGTGDGDTALIPVCGTPGSTDPATAGALGALAATINEQVGDAARAARDADTAATRAAAAASDRRDERTARTVFDGPRGIGSGGWGDEGLSGTRAPTPAERGDATRLARALQRAQYRDRSVALVGSVVPPGRFRSREAVKRSAEQALGLPPTAEPFRRKVRRHVDQPPITVGIGCDISGSMQWATRDVASAAWIVAHAVHRADGDCATVAYGNNVHPVVGPGEIPDVVREFSATGGTEDFTTAVSALTGALRFTTVDGAKLLVVISDGHYTSTQRTRGQVLVDRLTGFGVKVVWIGFNGGRHSPRRVADEPFDGAQYVHIADPTQMGAIIGGAMVKALTCA